MKLLVGFILSVFGSILNVFISLFFGVVFLLVILVNDVVSSGGNLDTFISSIGIWSVLFAIWFLFFSILGFIYANILANDLTIKKGGVGCLIIGVLTFNIFLVISGFMGLFGGRNGGL